jgi:two-component system OmpR family response regulator
VIALARKILVVDDETKILQMIADFLTNEGFQVLMAVDGQEALRIVEMESPDLMVLDIMLPEQSGWEVCRQVRINSDLPIIMLTARSDEIDKLLGLELGADDYITKPFSLRELTARIRAVLRRYEKKEPDGSEQLKFGSLVLDAARFEAWLDGRPLSLTPTEFKIIYLLAENPGQVFSRLQILEKVYGEAYEGYERSIDTHVSNIRKKIEPDTSHSTYIGTVYGIGYKFIGTRE